MQVERDRSARNPEPTFRVPECIPIFPLPNVVFFPRAYLPLHIFEPRYREMCADANASGQCIGMALLKEGWEQDYYGNPPIFAVGCVGRLVGVHRLPDGRLNIVLQGLQRYEIQEPLYGKSYRQARITLKPSGSGGVLEPSVKSELVRLLTQYLRAREVGYQWREFCRPDVEDEILVNHLSAYLDFTSLEKQFLLEAESLLQQARRLSDLIRFKIHEWEGARGWG
ncbi:LON peptidase substrate-binding domain-containing protein [Nitrospiraceae bacterium AH_259_D15_M11_P09]|nr:LON peptidase substrate-binding domain-containing protein [Nitrospiraceae bacterium AH_259_D15_M11_P09]